MCTVDEILHGSMWRLVSPLLTTDDVVRLRVVASRWNVGNRHGRNWRVLFPTATERPTRETLALRHERQQDVHDDEEDKPICGRLPKVGASSPTASSSGAKTLEMTSFGDVAMSLTGHQIADEKYG